MLQHFRPRPYVHTRVTIWPIRQGPGDRRCERRPGPPSGGGWGTSTRRRDSRPV